MGHVGYRLPHLTSLQLTNPVLGWTLAGSFFDTMYVYQCCYFSDIDVLKEPTTTNSTNATAAPVSG